MSFEMVEASRICLDGDWSMSGVAERFPILAKHLTSIPGTQVTGKQPVNSYETVSEIDLSGVADFDACGCQLLALFVGKLRQNGINAQLINMSDTLRSKVRCFGFHRELNLPL